MAMEERMRSDPMIATTWVLAIVAASTAFAETSPAAASAALASMEPTTASGPPVAERLQVLLLDLQAIDVPADTLKLLSAQIAAELSRENVDVVTSADLRTMASLEADRSVAGCDPNSSTCLAEIASALGTRLVISGRVGRLDDQLIVQLSLFDSQAGRAVARQDARGPTLTSLADALPDVVDRLIRPVVGPSSATKVASDTAGLSTIAIGGGIVGVAGIATGTVLGVMAVVLDGTLGDEKAARTDRQFAYDYGQGIALAAAASGVVGVVGVAVCGIGLLE